MFFYDNLLLIVCSFINVGMLVLIFRILSVTTVVLLSGCSFFSSKNDVSIVAVDSNKTGEVKERITLKGLKDSIDPDVLYTLLTAELAGQRGQYDIALEGYLIAAKKSKDPKFAERAVMIAMYTKDNAKTNEALDLWLKLDAKNQAARKIATLVAIRAGDRALAVEQLNAVLGMDPDAFEGVLLELTALLEKEGKQSEVSEVLEALLAKHPDNADISFIQALLAIQNKDKKLAEIKINQALKLKPDWDKALILKAQISILSGDLGAAKSLLTQASIKFPTNLKISKMLAQVLIKSNQFKEALGLYHKIVVNNPADVESQMAEALVYMQLNQTDEAEAIFKKFENQSEWKYQSYFYLGKIKEKQGQIKKAIALFDKVSDGAFAFDAGISVITLLHKDKQFDEVDLRLSSLQAKFPKQKIKLMLIQAEFYSQQKEYEKSLVLINRALADYPNQKEFLYARALIAEHLNKMDIVEGDLKKILEVEPNNVEALNALGYSLLNRPDRYSDAEKYLKKAIFLAPNEAVIVDSYGWLQFKLGNAVEALELLQRAYEKQKENEIAAHLAEVLWALGKKEEAEKLFNQVVRENPNDEYLKDVGKRIFKGAKQ